VKKLREQLPKEFPGTEFAFLPADMTSQILNFGAPAPLDVSITGRNSDENEAYAMQIMKKLRAVPGIADVRLQQSTSYPQLNVHVDRTRADALGITERDVTNSMVASLAGSGQVAPAFWLNPKNGVSYAIVAATPQYKMDSMADLARLPVTSSGTRPARCWAASPASRANPAPRWFRTTTSCLLRHLCVVQDRDLGAVATDVNKVLARLRQEPTQGHPGHLRGQVGTMNEAFSGLLFGLLGAVVMIYLLIVVNFQSWLDPFVIITALPAALAGIVWMLFISHTTLSVPALTGAIMCMGVATANSILVVSFCRERLADHGDRSRLRWKPASPASVRSA
jgi:multidrug efflux pump subunit AcrB